MLNNYKYSVSEIAEAFQYTRGHIRDLANKGKLPHIKRGREYRFDLAEVSGVLINKEVKKVDLTGI